MLLERMEWQYLPDAGGLLDQPEALMDDLLTISYVRSRVEEMLKSPVPAALGALTKRLRRKK